MEEQLLFTRIHDALDIPTPPGAYERLRSQLTKKPVRPFRWPALQTRWSKMSFRFAAGLAIIAIAVAAAAAAVAIHNASNNVSPAGSRMSIEAYQRMVASDETKALATYSSPCDIGVHSGCGVDAERAIPALTTWIGDLSSQDIPARFLVINSEMRNHLQQSLAAQHDLLAASQRNDGPGMDRAFKVAVYGEEWTSAVVPAITASHEVDSAGYISAVVANVHALDSCGAACGFTSTANSCSTSSGLTCLDYFDKAALSFAGFSAGLIQNAVPAALSAKDAKLQLDLQAADAVLISMRPAAAADDQAGFNSGIAKLLRIKTQIDLDAATITG